MKNESNFIIADDNNNDEEMCFIGESEIKGDVIASFNFNSDSCSAEKQTDAPDTDIHITPSYRSTASHPVSVSQMMGNEGFPLLLRKASGKTSGENLRESDLPEKGSHP